MREIASLQVIVEIESWLTYTDGTPHILSNFSVVYWLGSAYIKWGGRKHA